MSDAISPMMNPNWIARAVTPAEAVSLVKSGDRVFVHGAAATPTTLTNALALRRDIDNV